MERSTKGYIPRNNVDIGDIIEILNSDSGTLTPDNLDVREIFDQIEQGRKGNLYGAFVNGDGKPNTAPATRDQATDYTTFDPQVPGTTPEALIAAIRDSGSFDLGDLRGYGGQGDNTTSELPEIYWKSALDHKGYEKLPQTQEELDTLKSNNAYPGIVLALPYSEDDVSKYIDDNNTENYFSINQSVLFADKDKADIEKYFRLNTKVGVDYNNGGPESAPLFNIKVTPYLGVDFPRFESEINPLFSFAGVNIPIAVPLTDFLVKKLFDYWSGPKSPVEVIFYIPEDIIAVSNFLAIVISIMSISSDIWQLLDVAFNQPEIEKAPYQYKNLVGNLYNFLDIYESGYKFGFGTKNFGYDLESPTGADKSSFERYIRQTGEKYQYSLNDFNYSGTGYSETNLINEFPADSPTRSKYLNMTFDPQGVQYDLQTPPPMISYLVELEAVQNCKLSRTKPTKFIVSTTPYDYKYPYFDVTTPMNPNTILDTDLTRIYDDAATSEDRGRSTAPRDTPEIPLVNPRRPRRPATDHSSKFYDIYNNTPINFINAKWCDFIGLIDKEIPDDGGWTLLPILFPETFRHIAINTDSQWKRKREFYFGNNKYLTPVQNNISSQGAEVFSLLDVNGDSMINTNYEDDYLINFYNERTPQLVSNYNFRAGNTDELLYNHLKPYWTTVDWDITQGAAFCNNANSLNTIYQELPRLRTDKAYFLDIDVDITSGKLAFITGRDWHDKVFTWYRIGSEYLGTGGNSDAAVRPYFLDDELPEGISYGATGHDILIESSGKYRLCIRTLNSFSDKRIEFQASEGFTGKINSTKLTVIGRGAFTDPSTRGCYAINQINGRNKTWNVTYINSQSPDYNFEFNVHDRYEPISLDVTVPDDFTVKNITPNSTKLNIIWGYTDLQAGTQTVTEDYDVTAEGEIISINSNILGLTRTLDSDWNMPVTFEADFGELGIIKAYSMQKLECHDSNLRIVKDRYGSLYGADIDLSNSGVEYKFFYLPFVINSLDISNTNSLDDTMDLTLNGSIESSINISNTNIYGVFDNIINIPTIICTDCNVSIYKADTKPEGSFTYDITWKDCNIPSESLTRLLIDLDLSGSTDGYLDISGNNPAISDTYALDAIDSLISKGWNIIYNAYTEDSGVIVDDEEYYLVDNEGIYVGNGDSEIVYPPVNIAGKEYKTVIIGNQTWLAENLAYDDQGGEIYAYNDNESNVETYGRLYTWDAAIRVAASIDGWHLPTDAEWKALEMYLGMSQTEVDDIGGRGTNEGSKLAGNEGLWLNGDLVQNSEFNSSGFNFIPGGYNNSVDSGRLGEWGYCWDTRPDGFRAIPYNNTVIYRSIAGGFIAYSVRLIKD